MSWKPWRGRCCGLRALLWLAWDVLVDTVAWSIGWPFWRALTLGRFPHAGWREDADAGVREALLVCGAGMLALLAAIWGLSPDMPG